MPVLPTIHTNGSDPNQLHDQYVAAYRAIEAALTTFEKVEFNARDYYPAGEEAVAASKAERIAHAVALKNASNYCIQIAAHCQKFRKK